MTSHENRSFSFQTFLHFKKDHHKIFNSSKLVNFLLSEGGPSLAHSENINFIGSARISRGTKRTSNLGKDFSLQSPEFYSCIQFDIREHWPVDFAEP